MNDPAPNPHASDPATRRTALAQTPTRRALVTGASGYVGGLLVPRLLDDGWIVRVLTRDSDHLDAWWVDDVEVVEGDASSADDLRAALAEVTAAYFLIHSMEGGGGFADEDREVAQTFAAAAEEAGVRRIVYLSGLHPDGELSEHLSSRVEVGDILLDSGVPTAVLQAAVVLGHGSASFEMLRYLTTRLPAMIAPKWLNNRIQPIAVDDALHYLVAAASLPDDVNRTFDIGGPEVLTYAEMMQEFAAETGLRRRLVQTVPVMTPELASRWVGLVTPVNAKVARPLVGSLAHEVIVKERDLDDLVGPPPGGHTTYREGVAKAMRGVPPDRAFSIWAATVGAVAATAAAGTAVTDPTSTWYRRLDLPSWQPPGPVFPIAWSVLYADLAVTCASALVTLDQRAADGDRRSARRRDALVRALAVNLVVNFGWSALFFRAKKPAIAAVEAALLAASSTDLVRRVAAADARAGAALSPYAAWTTFATALSTEIWRRNRR